MRNHVFNSIRIVVLFLMCSVTLFSASLKDVYKKGEIKIIPDRNFAKDINWNALFFDENKSILVTADGTIFVANSRSHNFYKFSPNGKLMGTYGQKGQGPGDLYFPQIKSSLDEKYLVFNEYSSNRSISLFDFSGRSAAKLKVKADCFDAVGLKDGVVAYYSNKFASETIEGKSLRKISLHFLYMNDRKEIELPFGELYSGFIKFIGNGVISPSPSYLGNVMLTRLVDGNLLAGLSNSADMKIFSPGGKVMKTFSLKIKPLPVTKRYIERMRELTINGLPDQIRNKEIMKMARNAIAKSDYAELFAKFLPYYKSILVDSEGNILVFKWLEVEEKSKEIFQVYSPAGEYICETILDKGMFDINVYGNFQTMQFTGSAFYAIVKDIDDEDSVRLIKVSY